MVHFRTEYDRSIYIHSRNQFLFLNAAYRVKENEFSIYYWAVCCYCISFFTVVLYETKRLQEKKDPHDWSERQEMYSTSHREIILTNCLYRQWVWLQAPTITFHLPSSVFHSSSSAELDQSSVMISDVTWGSLKAHINCATPVMCT